MNPKCQQAVQAAAAAAGKALTKAQVKAIDDGLSAKMRELAGRDRATWRTMTADQQLETAGRALMQDIVDAAQRRADNAQRQIAKVAETDARIVTLQDSFKGTSGHDGTRAEALKRDYEISHQVIAAMRREAQGGLMALIEAAGDKHGVGFGRAALMTVFDAENPIMTRDIVREVFRNADGSTGNKQATIAARAWLDTIEGLRTRFNAAGGDVGKLEYGYAPQPHDAAKVRKAGANAWVNDTMPLLDRRRYLREDGSQMDDGEVRAMLRASWDTLQSQGINKMVPGQFHGTGKRADRHGDARQIHFANGDAWVEYMAKYGKGSIYDAMMGHIGGMTRDIGLIERYGPDANANARLQFELAAKEDGRQVNNLTGHGSIAPQTYWDIISGKVGMPVDEGLARTATMLRNLNVASKLGGAVVSSVTDLGTLAVTAGYNRLPYWQLMKDIGSQASKDTREFMSAHGMIAESTADALNRWSGDNLGSNWSGKLANSVMRWSFLNAWTDGLRQGFTLSMNAGLAKMAKMQWGNLHEFDRSRLTRSGITEADWGVLNGVAPTLFKGRELLSPHAIPDRQLAAKLFGFINDEAEYAVVNPDLRTRAILTAGGTQAGTYAGEIARTVTQFKSFPVAMMTRHWARFIEGNHGADGAPLAANRLAYGIAMMATLTGLGAVATQAKQMLQGKDPIDMTGDHAGRFWVKALVQGGGLSIAGDLFLIDPSGGPGDAMATALKNLAGPTVGTVGELALKVVAENIWQEAEGKTSHWQAELSRWAQSNTPAGNLWWLKPMMDHAFLNAMNENMSPGYLSRMKQRAQKDWGNGSFWWQPNQTSPDRAPEFEKAFGI